MSERGSLLEGRGIVAGYGGGIVLHGVDLAIASGETVALMGRNGMGKTTLIRTLMGLLPLQHGQISVLGRTMTGAPTHRIVRRGLAYVPEGRGIFPNLSVRENLLMAARAAPDGRRDWTLDRVLESFPRLTERLAQGGGQLSGGEQQMLAIGRALMTNPRLLILDEATEGLAPKVAHEIWHIVRGLSGSGMASLIVDRNWSALRELATRCVVLSKGRVVFEGIPETMGDAVIQAHLGV